MLTVDWSKVDCVLKLISPPYIPQRAVMSGPHSCGGQLDRKDPPVHASGQEHVTKRALLKSTLNLDRHVQLVNQKNCLRIVVNCINLNFTEFFCPCYNLLIYLCCNIY